MGLLVGQRLYQMYACYTAKNTSDGQKSTKQVNSTKRNQGHPSACYGHSEPHSENDD